MDEMHDNGRTIDAAGAAQTLPSLFDAGSHSAPATPQSTLRSTAPLRGTPSGRGAADAPAPNPRREALPQTGAREPNLCREALPQTGAREPNLCREALPLLGEVARSAEGVSGVESGAGEKRESGLKSPCHCETSSQTGRGNPRPLTSPQRGGSTPPLCKGRWVGVSRAGGIAQQTEGQAPISGESAADPAADNPSAAPRRLPLHKGAESDAPESPLLRAHFARLCAEADALHRADPGFDLDTALRDPAFVRLTAPDVGVPVADAWYALHRREYAETLRRESLEQAAAAVASGSLRPREGGRASGGELLGTDPRHMTAAQRAELRDRIKRGERVYPR